MYAIAIIYIIIVNLRNFFFYEKKMIKEIISLNIKIF